MTKKPTDRTEAPAADAIEGAQKLQLSVKRMKKLRVSVKGGASDAWASVGQPPSAPPPGATGDGWGNNAEIDSV